MSARARHLAGSALLLALAALAAAAAAAARVETVRGRLIDKACYERNPKNVGEKHVRKPIDECASTCVKFGLPVAVLTDDGKVYQIVGELAKDRNAKLVPHVTKRVEVQGDVTSGEEGALLIAATVITALPQ